LTKTELEEISELMNNYFHKPINLVESTKELIELIKSQEKIISSLQQENQQFKIQIDKSKEQMATLQQKNQNFQFENDELKTFKK
jgi:peptidoglycan hydrolase CwlO-like protein